MNQLFSTYADGELWQSFKNGDEEAYAYIYHQYAPQLYNYGLHLLRNRQLVEDCMHDLFVYLYEHRQALGYTDSIKFYLFRSLRRKISEAVQSQKMYTDELNTEVEYNFEIIHSPEKQYIEEASAQLLHNQVLEAINKLPKQQREAIYLLYYNGLRYQEVADIMSLKIRTIYNQVHTALHTLKDRLSKSSSLLLIWLFLVLLLPAD